MLQHYNWGDLITERKRERKGCRSGEESQVTTEDQVDGVEWEVVQGELFRRVDGQLQIDDDKSETLTRVG